ncbi:MAG: SsrA-binding protein SmpB [Vampirovibrio sp.]|nr:SsrA-binding protein SmpB [Vampirovibrio sp.]
MSKKSSKKSKSDWLIANNKKAYHEYHVLEQFKAGIMLTGSETKSIRAGKVSMSDAHARILNGEVFLHGLNISIYEQAGTNNHDPDRVRKLLLKKDEINKLKEKTKELGLTLIPLKLFFDRCWVKVDLGLCKGKKLHDKRATKTEQDTKRQIERSMKQFR